MQRRTLLGLTAWPLAACSIQPLKPLPRLALGPQTRLPDWREPVVGQSWTYQVLNMYNGERVDTVQETVAAVSPQPVLQWRSARHGELPEEVQSRWGQTLQDAAWDRVQRYRQALPLLPEGLQPGSHTSVHTRYRPAGASYDLWIAVQARVVGFERIDAAGVSHETVRIERLIRLEHEDSGRLNYTRSDTLWVAPQIGRWVVRETRGEYWRAAQQPFQIREDHLRWVSESWRTS